MELRWDPLSWNDLNGDIAWAFEVHEGDRVWQARAGVRLGARGAIIAAARLHEHGDWTAAMLAHAAAALRLAAPSEGVVWVDRKNFAEVHRVVEDARHAHAPLFRSGTVEDRLQFGSP